MDWRIPDRTHNNVPPSLNIYVRYYPLTWSGTYSMSSYGDVVKHIEGMRSSGEEEDVSTAEAQYESSMVCELPAYSGENLTTHDYLLRVAICADNLKLMKQTLLNLLDIFATRTNDTLSRDE